MGKAFEFIDGTKSDRSTRRQALSHVMKGKNVGRTHHRRSRLNAQRPTQHIRNAHLPTARRLESDASSKTPTQVPVVRELLLTAPLPIAATPQSERAIHQFFEVVIHAVYPQQLCHSLELIQSYWLPALLEDQTSYHCTISLMAIFNKFFFDRESVPPEAIYHLNQAVRLVNQALHTEEALSDSNLTVVNFLVVFELVQECKLEAEIHLKGLQKMVQLRGGLSQLGENSPLALKICKTGVDYALHYGSPSCFYRDHISDVAREVEFRGYVMERNLANLASRFDEMDPFLRQILLDVNSIASLYNENIDFRLDPNTVQEIIISVGCRLVQFHPLYAPQLNRKLESACHTGLAAFTTTLFIQLGSRRFLKYNLVAECLESFIEAGWGEEDNDVVLWLLFIGGISVLDRPNRVNLNTTIRQVARSLGIDDWAGVHKTIVNFPWINSLHDEPGKLLWDRVIQGPVGGPREDL